LRSFTLRKNFVNRFSLESSKHVAEVWHFVRRQQPNLQLQLHVRMAPSAIMALLFWIALGVAGTPRTADIR